MVNRFSFIRANSHYYSMVVDIETNHATNSIHNFRDLWIENTPSRKLPTAVIDRITIWHPDHNASIQYTNNWDYELKWGNQLFVSEINLANTYAVTTWVFESFGEHPTHEDWDVAVWDDLVLVVKNAGLAKRAKWIFTCFDIHGVLTRGLDHRTFHVSDTGTPVPDSISHIGDPGTIGRDRRG
jgi:hypothetical protein